MPFADPDLARLVDEAQAHQLPALIADWEIAGGDRAWLARALRIDLALLTERPELAVPCLYRRCAFAGDADRERHFYKARAPVSAGLPIDGDLASLRALVARWADAWGAEHRWLRSLRPPPIPIDGAVVEEYRAGVYGRLWVSADGERIGVVDDEARIAWDRPTGRRIEVAHPPAPPRTWTQDDQNYNTLTLVRGDERVHVPLGNAHLSVMAELADDLILCTGAEFGEVDVYALVDSRRGRVVWSIDGTCTSAAVLDGERLVIARRDWRGPSIDVVALASGTVLSSWACPHAGYGIVAIPGGDIATLDGGIVRVWRVAEAAARPQVEHPSTRSVVDAEFSPDGRHLFTGAMLCDAATGHHLAFVPCTGGGWMEGGPPSDCQRLCDGVFAELSPRNLRRWRSDDGSELPGYRVRGEAGDRAAFDPRARRFAVWHRDRTVTIHAMGDGAIVATHRRAGCPSGGRIEFSADGEQLAWQTREGRGFAVELARPDRARRLGNGAAPWPPARKRAIDACLLVAGGAALPFDDGEAAVSPDGCSFAGPMHHVRLDGRAAPTGAV